MFAESGRLNGYFIANFNVNQYTKGKWICQAAEKVECFAERGVTEKARNHTMDLTTRFSTGRRAIVPSRRE
jgi:hypothetical protein